MTFESKQEYEEFSQFVGRYNLGIKVQYDPQNEFAKQAEVIEETQPEPEIV